MAAPANPTVEPSFSQLKQSCQNHSTKIFLSPYGSGYPIKPFNTFGHPLFKKITDKTS